MTDSTDGKHKRPAALRSYVTGFLAAVTLTVIAFAVVIRGHALPRWEIIATISAAAFVQVAVHLYFFLHLDFSKSQRWNLLTFLFALIILIIFVGGTIWVVGDLNYRMM